MTTDTHVKLIKLLLFVSGVKKIAIHKRLSNSIFLMINKYYQRQFYKIFHIKTGFQSHTFSILTSSPSLHSL